MFEKYKSEYDKRDYRSKNYSGNWSRKFIDAYFDFKYKYGLLAANKEFSKSKDEHLPNSLYKFCTPNLYNYLNLLNGQVYLSNPRNFNDPFDNYVCLEKEQYHKLFLLNRLKELELIAEDSSPDCLSKEEYWRLFYSKTSDVESFKFSRGFSESYFLTLFEVCLNKSESFRNIINKIRINSLKSLDSKIESIRNEDFKISCFSNFQDEDELLENTTMWSHYAENHKGFCIKFKIELEEKLNYRNLKLSLFPIKYTSTVSKLSIQELLKVKLENSKMVYSKSILKSVFKSLITKSRFWSYEKEWRLIMSEHNYSDFLNNTCDFFPIESVYLGCNIDSALRNNIILLAKKMNFKVFKTIQSNEKFVLQSVEVDQVKVENDIRNEYFNYMNRISDDVLKTHLKNVWFKKYY